MKEIDPAPLTPASSANPAWQLAQRVADSPNFRNCPKLRAFLLYVCENALLGRLENVREQLIGSRVFGRPAGYNLNEDNIVRVEAREMRKRLAEYFAGDGRLEPLLLEIPKGGYAPLFRPRDEPALESPEPAALENPAAPAVAPAGLRSIWLTRSLAAGLLMATVGAVWLGVENRRLRQAPPHPSSTRPAPPSGDYSFYSEILGSLGATPDRETLLTLSNPRVVLFFGSQTTTPVAHGPGYTIPAPPELRVSFAEALNNQDMSLPYYFLRATREDYTGIGEAVAAFHMGRLMQYLRRPIRLSQGRFLNWDHVQTQNLIILGAPQINDWTFRNVAKSNFNFDTEFIENVKPLAGEEKEYRVRAEPGKKVGTELTDYGVIKMVTSPYGFNMLLLAGMSSAGTAGVGEFFATPEKMKPVYERLRAAAPGKPMPSNWEVLVRIDIRDAFPVGTSAVALRPAASAQ